MIIIGLRPNVAQCRAPGEARCVVCVRVDDLGLRVSHRLSLKESAQLVPPLQVAGADQLRGLALSAGSEATSPSFLQQQALRDRLCLSASCWAKLWEGKRARCNRKGHSSMEYFKLRWAIAALLRRVVGPEIDRDDIAHALTPGKPMKMGVSQGSSHGEQGRAPLWRGNGAAHGRKLACWTPT